MMIIHYIKVAVRHILKYKTQNLISILGLSVGILCFSICVYCTRFIYDTNKCFANAERMAELRAKYDISQHWGLPPTVSLMNEVQQRFPQEVEAVTYTIDSYKREFVVEAEDGKQLPYRLKAREVDSLFNKVFAPTILYGSWDAAARTPNSMILVQSAAKRLFGSGQNAIGKRVTYPTLIVHNPDGTNQYNGEAYTVQVVIADFPMNTTLAFMEKLDMLLLNDNQGRINDSENYNGQGVVLLRQGFTAHHLEARFRATDMKHKTILRNGQEQKAEELSVAANPFTGKTTQRDSAYWVLALVPAIVGGLILLVGLLNFFHFLVGSFLNRRHEYGIRKAAGGSTVQLFVQLSVQSVLISLLAFLFAFCLIELSAPYLHLSLFMVSIVIEQELLMIHAAEYMVLILLLCLLLSLVTAWRVRHVSIYAGIHGGEVKWSKHRLRNVLLGIQFFICWLFTTTTVALYLQAEKTQSVVFSTLSKQEKQNILSINLRELGTPGGQVMTDLVERMAQHSGVMEKLTTHQSLLIQPYTPMHKKEGDKEVNIPTECLNVSPAFFRFMNVPLTAGTYATAPDEVVIDERLAASLGDVPLGMTLYGREDKAWKVCGVCPTFTHRTLNGRNPYFVLMNEESNVLMRHCYLKCTPGQTEEVKQHVTNLLREVLPGSVEPEVKTLLEDIRGIRQDIENKLKGIVLFFSIVSIIITLLGVYSAITLDTERRQKEVAIRKINGAGMKQIVLLFARLYITLLVVSAVLAFPFAYMIIYIGKMFWAVHFNSGPVFWCSIFGFVAAVTALTVLFRILKIARINPAEVIKNE